MSKFILSMHVTLWTRVFGPVWKSVSSCDMSVYVCVSKCMHAYVVSICLLLCRRKGAAEDETSFICSFKKYSLRR